MTQSALAEGDSLYGGSPYPCDIDYQGPLAFSEPCVRHLSLFIEANSDVIDTVISAHSYGQLLLYPYNFDLVSVPPNVDLHVSLCDLCILKCFFKERTFLESLKYD